MGDILAAVDGTNSKKWMTKRGGNSHVFQFGLDFVTSSHLKKYFAGPNTSGSDVGAITDQVCRFVQESKKQNPQARICLIGHSRGGLIAILAARRLQLPIEFLGLYDAVDRHWGPGGETISANVKMVYHALRDPFVNSRPYFGNTGLEAEPSVQCYRWRFRATHGGIGGDPQGGKNEHGDAKVLRGVYIAGFPVLGVVGLPSGISPFDSFDPKVDLATDTSEGQRADRWIRMGAKLAGFKLR
jgi:hypothetical protein